MKNLKHLFTALLLLCNTIAFAEEVTINGIKYDVITKAKQAKVISGGNYSGNIVIPATIEYNGATYSITSIGERAFEGCSGLTSITIPNSVTSIGESAFFNCWGLTSITIPNSVTSIGDDTFRFCSSLTSITIPNSVTSIGIHAFSGCSGLTNATIGNSVTSIGYGAFEDCSSLTSITIPNSVTSIGGSAFKGCSSLTSVTIPNSVTSIEGGAFYYCSGLTSITIPNNVTSIGGSAFKGCSSLTSVTIPNNVTSIREEAFAYCSGLTSITIGSELRYIYSKAFAYCSSLTDVYCYATTVPTTLDEYGWESCYDIFEESYPEYMTLHVPAEAINDYKANAPWSSFGTIVALNGGTNTTPQCANPTIVYNNGTLSFDCATANAEFVSEITCDDADKYYISSINLSATYNISVYATATGYDNSETVNATLCWIENGNIDNETNVINIPATAVLITSSNGTLSINCSLDGESVEIYTTNGTFIGTTSIVNGNATIQTGLAKGSVAIVKIGNKSVKVILN